MILYIALPSKYKIHANIRYIGYNYYNFDFKKIAVFKKSHSPNVKFF